MLQGFIWGTENVSISKFEVLHVIWTHRKSASFVQRRNLSRVVSWRVRVCEEADDITSLPPWFWGTAVHCGLHWLGRRLCWERSRGTPWLAAWTAPLDTGTGRSDCAPLKRERTRMFRDTKRCSLTLTLFCLLLDSTVFAALEMSLTVKRHHSDGSHPPLQFISVAFHWQILSPL